MKWIEVFKQEDQGDRGYVVISDEDALLLFGNKPIQVGKEFTDQEEDKAVELLESISGWTRTLLERCGCGPAGRVIVEVAEVISKPDDIIVELRS